MAIEIPAAVPTTHTHTDIHGTGKLEAKPRRAVGITGATELNDHSALHAPCEFSSPTPDKEVGWQQEGWGANGVLQRPQYTVRLGRHKSTNDVVGPHFFTSRFTEILRPHHTVPEQEVT